MLDEIGIIKMQIFAKKKKKGGFTLIELLVVIAIIGILASIVLVSLSGARTRAKDTRIVADLNQIRTLGELINSIDGDYTNIVDNVDINGLITDMTSQGGTNILKFGNAAGYCVEATLGGGKWACVNSGLTATFNLASNPQCNGTATSTPTNINCAI
jgi:prepilin-type N-terminal cleavage/methylation domain-containing protein